MSTNTKFCDEDITLTYNYSGAEKEHVLACKNRPFAVLCSTNLPTPSSSLIDHNLVKELGLKMTNLQCKKIVFLGRKLRLLGKISTTVQCIRNGNVCFNIHFRASVIENLSNVIDSHCVAGQKMALLLSGGGGNGKADDKAAAKVKNKTKEAVSSNSVQSTPRTRTTSSSAASPALSTGTPSSTGLTPISFSAKTLDVEQTPPSRAQMLVMDDGMSPLTANLTIMDEMFGGADVMSDEEEEQFYLDQHNPPDDLVYRMGHGRYKCNRVQCNFQDDPCMQVPQNCGYHQSWSLPYNFQPCNKNCRGAFCNCLKFYKPCD